MSRKMTPHTIVALFNGQEVHCELRRYPGAKRNRYLQFIGGEVAVSVPIIVRTTVVAGRQKSSAILRDLGRLKSIGYRSITVEEVHQEGTRRKVHRQEPAHS
jgi:hypothetical protein